MTAADLIAGARTLIEPLNGRNLFEAAPVMRDTIAALLDDRDALTQRIEALEAALRFYIDPDNWLIGGPLDGDSPNYTGGPGRDALQADEATQ